MEVMCAQSSSYSRIETFFRNIFKRNHIHMNYELTLYESIRGNVENSRNSDRYLAYSQYGKL